jgi:Ca-activated chloride channel family protein
MVGRAVQGIVFIIYLGLATAAGATAKPPPTGLEDAVAGARHWDEVGAGELLLRAGAGSYRPAVQLQASVHFQISGLIAHVRLEQTFRNDSADWVEGNYLFPLPDDAAVNRLRLVIGERVIVGEIREKQAAREIYQQALASGRKAGLVEQRRPNLFSNRVANIAPGETVTVELDYIQRVSYRDGLFSLRFPMTITPRYKGGADVWQFLDPRPATAAEPLQPIRITADLDMGLPLASVDAPYHALALSTQGQAYRIALADGVAAMHRDFLLQWRPVSGSEPQAALFNERVGGEDYALLMVLPPAPQAAQALPRELIFVIDTSGSMGGTSIDQARASLAFALDQLRGEDRFNIIEFNNQARALYPQAVDANDHNLSRAREFVRHLDAGGGTEMLSALSFALPTLRPQAHPPTPGGPSDPAGEERVRQVVFITDGAVGNELELFREIEQRIGRSRLFTVGIGSAPNSWFMRKAAQVGRGDFTFIGDVLEVRERMQALFERLSQTLVADFDVVWPTAVETWPRQIPDLYPGEPLLLVARGGAGLSDGIVTVSGRSAGEDWQRTLAFATPAKGEGGHRGVATLWARAKIASLLDEKILGADEASIRAQVLPVALQHQLVSPYTSFVAVEQQPSRPAEVGLKSVPVPNLRPQGQSPQPFAYPRTATPARLHLLTGTALLLVVLFAFALSRRTTACPVPG